jgi:sec-independent protein translocase protein TatA
MGAFGIWQWIIILAIVLILFARPGKISGIMGDVGKGLNKFKAGLKDDDPKVIEAKSSSTVKTAKKKTAKKKKAAKKS